MKSSWLAQEVSATDALLVLTCIAFPYHYGLLYQSLTSSLCNTAVIAIAGTLVLRLALQGDLLRNSLCYLALPYLFFIPSWFNTPAALVLGFLMLYGLKHSLPTTTALTTRITRRDMLAFIGVLIWVNLSGIGGYGYQWGDYVMHNARLHDLVMEDWPVRYGKDQNLVYYIGYFIPAAVVGKLLGLQAALLALYGWAVFGVMLVLRWLAQLSGWRLSIGLALLFFLFGPLDLINYHYLASQLKYTYQVYWWERTDYIDFATRYYLNFFIGNYLSNTYQFFVSPQQVLAGWLGAGMLTGLYLRQQQGILLFVYSLLCLWAPLPMIALAPLVFTAFAHQRFRQLWTPVNIAGLIVLAAFVLFYLGGSAGQNPSFWLWERGDWANRWDGFLAFLLCGWGFFVLAMVVLTPGETPAWRWWLAGLVLSLLLLPLRSFGEVGDLLCRGSAPLMFLLLVLLLRALERLRQAGQPLRAGLLVLLLVAGFGSAVLTLRLSLRHYGETYPMSRIVDHVNAYPNLGPDDSLFNRWLRLW